MPKRLQRKHNTSFSQQPGTRTVMGGARVSWRAPPTRVSPRDRRRPRLLSELSELESFSSGFQSKRAQPSGPRRGPSELWRGHFGRAGFSPMRLVPRIWEGEGSRRSEILNPSNNDHWVSYSSTADNLWSLILLFFKVCT